MLCYKGISYSLSRLRFRFATSAVSVDAFKYYVQTTNNFFLHFSYIFQKNILIFSPLHPRKQKPMSVIVVSPL